MGASVPTPRAPHGCRWSRVGRAERPCGQRHYASTLLLMFARYFVELPVPPRAVEDAVLRAPSTWIPGLASTANHRGDALLAEVGFGDEVRVARQVAIEFGEPVRMPTKTVLPLRWNATGAAGLFPSLDADLEIAPMGAGRTQLAISARYVPPLGALGRVIDRTVLFRVAEATLKDFLDRVADTLLSQFGSVANGAPGA